MSTAPKIRTEVQGRVAVLTIDAPERRNAFDLEMCRQTVEAVDAVEADDAIGAVVVTGAPPAFCAGADLSHLGTSQREGLLAIYEGFLRVARCSLPTIAAVNGPAVGAGMNLALACDVRVAAPSARFDTRFLQLGIHPGGGHTWMMRGIVGRQAAAAMVLFGETLDGRAVVDHGLAWACVEADEDLLSAAVEMAGRAADAPREVAIRAKATIADMEAVTDHETAVERELGDQVWSVAQPAFAKRLEAMAARISKRA